MSRDDVVRRLDGPFGRRWCRQLLPGIYRWEEQSLRGSAGLLDGHALRLLATCLPTDLHPWAWLPEVRTGIAMWPTLPAPTLVLDQVLRGGGGELSETLATVGAQLARLHAVPVAPTGFSPLPVRRVPAWFAGNPAAAGAVGRIRARLRLAVGDRLDRWLPATPPAPPGPVGPRTLIHGRFSTAVCVPGPVPVVLGWREAGLGDPRTDLAHLLAELVEAAALAPDRGHLAGTAAAFLAGYRGLAPPAAGLAALTVSRIVDHVATRAWVSGNTTSAVAFLTTLAGQLPDLFDLVGFGAEVSRR
jgi:aminoglycoside phosphotransferase (APT) family kinase protein